MDRILLLRQAAQTAEARFAIVAQQVAAELLRPVAERSRSRLQPPLQEIEALRRAIHATLAKYDALALMPGVRPVAGSPAADMRFWADTQRFFREVRNRYLRWRQVGEAIDTLLDWKGLPLYPDPPEPDSLEAEQQKATEAVFRLLHRLINPAEQDASAIDHGCFADIPLPAAEFAAHAHAAMRVAQAYRKSSELRFLDVGCGGGLKLLQAARFFAVADGLEYDSGYVASARRFLTDVGHLRGKVIEADALRFSDYGSYDAISFYRPMRGDDALQRLEDRIAGQARPGTVLIAPYGSFESRLDSLNCAHLAGSIFVAGLDAGAADDLRQAAEQIAITAAPLPPEPDPLAGCLWPILAACHTSAYQLR